MFNQQTIDALAQLRHSAATHTNLPANVQWAINTLDDAGVFAALDEQTDYASAEDILAESAAMEQTKHHRGIRPEESLQVLHNTWNRRGDNGHRVMVRKCTCGQAAESHVSLHAGTCPVWTQVARTVDSLRPKGRTPSSDETLREQGLID